MSDTKESLLNFVVNQPEVLARVAPGYQDVDMSGFFKNPKSLMFGDEHGLVIFGYIGDGLYEGHYLLTNTADRRKAFSLMRKAIRAVFTEHHATAINGATPRDNLTARMVNRALGFHPVGETTDTMGRPCIRYRLERKLWEALSAASLAASAH